MLHHTGMLPDSLLELCVARYAQIRRELDMLNAQTLNPQTIEAYQRLEARLAAMLSNMQGKIRALEAGKSSAEPQATHTPVGIPRLSR